MSIDRHLHLLSSTFVVVFVNHHRHQSSSSSTVIAYCVRLPSSSSVRVYRLHLPSSSIVFVYRSRLSSSSTVIVYRRRRLSTSSHLRQLSSTAVAVRHRDHLKLSLIVCCRRLPVRLSFVSWYFNTSRRHVITVGYLVMVFNISWTSHLQS